MIYGGVAPDRQRQNLQRVAHAAGGNGEPRQHARRMFFAQPGDVLVEQAVESVQKFIQPITSNLQFTIDEDTGIKVVKGVQRTLIEDNILVAYYTGHDHRLGIKTTGVAADVDLIAHAPTDIAALLGDAERLIEIRDFHREWGDQDTDTLDLLTLWEQLGRLLGMTP